MCILHKDTHAVASVGGYTDVMLCVLQSERTLLFDAMKTELLEKIRRLEEDRQNTDLTSGTAQMSVHGYY